MNLKDLKFRDFFDYYSVIPLCMYSSLLYTYVISGEKQALYLCMYLFSCDVLVMCIKKYPWKNGTMYRLTRRPKGANRCDYLSKKTNYTEDSPGFPSGHMTSITVFSISMMIYLFGLQKYDLLYARIPIIMFHILLIVLMGLARYVKLCHSPLQIAAGFILGCLLSIPVYLTR